jgi:hypothetical protein
LDAPDKVLIIVPIEANQAQAQAVDAIGDDGGIP